MLDVIRQCPVCESAHFNAYLTCKDYLVSSQSFAIEQCQQCGFRFTNPRPDNQSIGSFYKSEQYVSHNDKGGGLINTAYRIVRNQTLRVKVKTISRLNGRVGGILDIGCGTGAFLEMCQQAGWKIMGTEPDSDARAVASQKLQMTPYAAVEDLPAGSLFDVITMWHVLEHIPDLNGFLPQLNRLLSPNGTLVIAVPNSSSYDAGYFQQYWAAYDVPRHLSHFTPDTIQPLFSRHGFGLVETLPMVFDAYYIALLSTKYKEGKTDYLQSVRVGLKSNQEARKSGQYSSLTYVFKQLSS